MRLGEAVAQGICSFGHTTDDAYGELVACLVSNAHECLGELQVVIEVSTTCHYQLVLFHSDLLVEGLHRTAPDKGVAQ